MLVPFVEVKMFRGRDESTKKLIAEGIIDLISVQGGVSPDAVQVLFTDVDRTNWIIGSVRE